MIFETASYVSLRQNITYAYHCLACLLLILCHSRNVAMAFISLFTKVCLKPLATHPSVTYSRPPRSCEFL